MNLNDNLPLNGEKGSNSMKTYVTPNTLPSNHYMKALNSGQNSNSGQNAPNLKPRDETRVKVDSDEYVSDWPFVIAPKGVFSNKKVRNDFVRKVYLILGVQLIATTIGAGIMFHFFKHNLNYKELKSSKNTNGLTIFYLLIAACIVISMSVSCAFCLSIKARRAVPYNFILLGVFTASETVFVGIVCCQYYGEGIIIAFIITGVVVLAITLLATTPWFDITNCGCLLFILLITHAVMGIVVWLVVLAFGLDVRIWVLLTSVSGAFLFSLYLLYDTQQILGGKRVEMNPEEYVYGAVSLYIDIIQIFLYILRIVGKR